MKNTKRILAIVCALVMAGSMATVVSAEEATQAPIAEPQATAPAKPVKKEKKEKKAKKNAEKKIAKSAAKASKVKRAGKMITIKYKKVIEVKDPVVNVVDEDGNEFAANFKKATRKSLKIKVAGMKKGHVYTLTFTGVKLKTEEEFGFATVKYQFGNVKKAKK